MSATITGLADLKNLLATLPAKIENNILRGAMRAGAGVIAEEAKRLVPSGPGRPGDVNHLRDSIKFSARSEPGLVTAKVQTKGPGAYKAPWIEFGTAAHYISVDDDVRDGLTVKRINRKVGEGSLVINGHFVGKSVHHPGARKIPFMRPAVDNKQGEAIEAISAYITQRCTKAGIETPDPVPSDEDQ